MGSRSFLFPRSSINPCQKADPELKQAFKQLVAIAVERARTSRAAKSDIQSQVRTDVSDLPEFARLRKLMLSDSDVGGAVLPDLSWCNNDDDLAIAIHVAVSKYIDFAVRTQLETPAEPFEQVFNCSCRDIKRYWNTTHFTWSFLAPLQNFRLDVAQPLHISDRVSVRQLTSEEREASSNRGNLFRPVSFGLEALSIEPRGRSLAPAAALAPVESALIALRLLKHKGVWAQNIGVLSDDPIQGRDGRLWWSPFEWCTGRRDPTFTDPSEAYTLSGNEVDDFCRLWHMTLDQLAQDDALTRALRKFDASYNQTRAEQVLLEIWGALEALFVPLNSRRISDTAAKTVSELVARNVDERGELYALLKESYRLRSRIVHGDHVDDSRLPRVCSDTIRCFREATLLRLNDMSNG